MSDRNPQGLPLAGPEISTSTQAVEISNRSSATLDDPEARIYVHCVAGVHRAPMMTLAV